MGFHYTIDTINHINNLILKKNLTLQTLEATLEHLGNNLKAQNEELMSYLNYKPYYQGLYTEEEKRLMRDDLAKYVETFAIKNEQLRKDIAEVAEDIARLTIVRDSIIERVLKYATFSNSEMIYLLEQFGINYRTMMIDNKTLLVPETFVLRKDKIGEGPKIDLMALDTLTEGKEYTVLTMYRKDNDALLGFNTLLTKLVNAKAVRKESKPNNKTSIIKKMFRNNKQEENRVQVELPELIEFYKRDKKGKVVFNEEALNYVSKELLMEAMESLTEEDLKTIYQPNRTTRNKRIKDIIPALEVYDCKGVPVYIRKDNSIALNPEVLNILPEEVLGFLDYYIEARYAGEVKTMEEALNIYRGNQRR